MSRSDRIPRQKHDDHTREMATQRADFVEAMTALGAVATTARAAGDVGAVLEPEPGSAPETRGWVLGTAHDWREGETLLNVFDVRTLDAGPLATARLPYALPLGLHGKFVAS